jgi:hypothetical protein
MKEITVLYPGGFKPVHGGHLALIKKYIERPDVNEVQILVGKGIRNGITQEYAVKMLEKLLEGWPKVSIITIEENSPVLSAYNILKESHFGAFALAASNKETENQERIKLFVEKHSIGGRFFKEGVEAVELAVDINPQIFEGRHDEYNGKPISSTILREDISKGNIADFQTGYLGATNEQILYIWNMLEGLTEKEVEDKDWTWSGSKWTRKK